MVRTAIAAIAIALVALEASSLQHGDHDGYPFPRPFGRPARRRKGFLFGREGARRQGAAAGEARMTQKSVGKKSHQGPRDLALMHVPYNFGHTIEKVAMFPEHVSAAQSTTYLASLGVTGGRTATWQEVRMLSKFEAQVWGHFNPDLQQVSRATGCQLYYTPQKYWPQHILDKYFGNKTVFGMLRDPYERLVAFFRGNIKGYGGDYPEFHRTCDVNGAVKMMLKRHIAGKNPFANACTFLPQAEFFDGPYGIKIPVDNRKFPASVNKVLLEHGYDDIQIRGRDIMHVSGCPHVWSGDLDNETKLLVQQVYRRDFELLCRHFGYCDRNEDTCISQVPEMCPQKVLGIMTQKNGDVLEGNEMHLLNMMRPGGV